MMLLDQSDTISLPETSLAKANSLPYSSRMSTVVSPSEAGSSASAATKDSLIYSMIAGNSTGSELYAFEVLIAAFCVFFVFCLQ